MRYRRATSAIYLSVLDMFCYLGVQTEHKQLGTHDNLCCKDKNCIFKFFYLWFVKYDQIKLL